MKTPNTSIAVEPATWGATENLSTAGVERIGERSLASRTARFGAALLDAILGFVALIPGILVSSLEDPYSDSFAGAALMGLGLIALLIIQSVMITTLGQSLGKKALRIKIVRHEDGTLPGFWRGVVMRQGVMGLISMIPVLGPIASFIDPLLIFGAERRCIHDHIAGTNVVQA